MYVRHSGETNKTHRMNFRIIVLFILALTFVRDAAAEEFIVTTTADNGAGSLREAINDANALLGTDTIVFHIDDGNATDLQVVSLISPLPEITETLVIQGASQNAYRGTDTSAHLIVLDGTGAGIETTGLHMISATASVIDQLVLVHFDGYGIVSEESGTVEVTNNLIGVMPDDTQGANGMDGVWLNQTHALVKGNVISGNSRNGILISGPSPTGTSSIEDNIIGLDQLGTTALSNGNSGVLLSGNIRNVTIGGNAGNMRNMISGNGGHGVYFTGEVSFNQISGNFIGIGANNQAIANGGEGVYLHNGAKDNIIGGDSPAHRNIISGNSGNGVFIELSSSEGNRVEGNYIGVDSTGNVAVGNGIAGVRVGTGAYQTHVLNNIMSGNAMTGLYLRTTTEAVVAGNLIGTDASGMLAVPNNRGIFIEEGNNNRIGGQTAAERNIISGNDDVGIDIKGTDSNRVEGNYIGLSADGNDLPNASHGVRLRDAGLDNIIGGTNEGSRNVIAANGGSGIMIQDPDVRDTRILNNYIGVRPDGSTAGGNDTGILIKQGARKTVIGQAGAGNTIGGSNFAGIELTGTGTDSTTIHGNYIGVNENNEPLPNEKGIVLRNEVAYSQVGSEVEGEGNVIAQNLQEGVRIVSGAADNNVRGNTIHVNGSYGIVVDSEQSVRNRIRANRIYNNGSLSISLGDGAIAANDDMDGDAGPNNLQNRPELNNATLSPLSFTVEGSLNTIANTDVVIEFFSSDATSDFSSGEARTYLGFVELTTDGSGNAAYTAILDRPPFNEEYISATAIRDDGNTSHFSSAILRDIEEQPGAGTDSLILWLKANAGVYSDDGTTNAEDQGPVFRWDDQGSLQNNALQSTAGNQPQWSSNNLNGYPAVAFDGSQWLALPDSVVPYGDDDYTIFGVVSPAAAQGTWLGGGENNPGEANLFGFQDNSFYNNWGGDAIEGANGRTGQGAVQLLRFGYQNDNGRAIYIDGEVVSEDDVTGRTGGGLQNMIGNNPLTDDFWTGNIYEIIIFHNRPEEDDRQSIATYLALKYGLSLGQEAAQDYIAPDGEVIYPAAASHAGYTSHVAGIAQNSLQGWMQTTGSSSLPGGIVTVTQPAALDNEEYLIWGNNGLPADSFVTNIPDTMTSRTARVWRVSHTGDVGEVAMQIYIGDDENRTVEASDYALLIANTDDFATPESVIAPGQLSNDTLYFENVSLEDGQYFSFSSPALTPPEANNVNVTIQEDELTALDVTFNDTDINNDLIADAVTIITGPENGTVDDAGNQFTYTPAADFFGNDSLQYEVCDEAGLCDSAWVFIEVLPVNDPPVTMPDTVELWQGCTVVLADVLGNDEDPDGEIDPQTLAVDTLYHSGAAYTIRDEQIELDYSNDIIFSGADSLKYTICDDSAACTTGMLYITVTPHEGPELMMPELEVIVNDTLTVAITDVFQDTTGIDTASFNFQNSYSGVEAERRDDSLFFDYSTQPDFIGWDTITVELCDQQCLCTIDTLFMNVKAINAANDTLVSLRGCFSDTVNVLENDNLNGLEIDTSKLVVTMAELDTPRYELDSLGNLSFSFGQNHVLEAGDYQLTYRLCSTNGYCDSATVVLRLLPHDNPEVQGGTYEGLQGEELMIDLSDMVSDTTGINWNSLSGQSEILYASAYDKGASTLAVDYASVIGEAGIDTVRYRVCDSWCLCSDTTLVIDVAPDPEKLVAYQGISPNGDGKNDRWKINFIYLYPENTVKVFNRWGQLMFEASGYDNETVYWDGTSLNGEQAPEGTYYYTIELEFEDAEPMTGFIELMR